MEEKKYGYKEIEVLYNRPGSFFHLIRREDKIDGDVIFYEFDTGEIVDLESYAIHGYKMMREKSMFLNQFKKYTPEEIESLEEACGDIKQKKREIPDEFLIDLNWLKDNIEQNRYNYDMPYKVEQIEIRYSEILSDFIFLYVEFNHFKKRLEYMDMSTGLPVAKEVLDLYTYYPRDDIFTKPTYTPRETIELRVQLNQRVRSLGKVM